MSKTIETKNITIRRPFETMAFSMTLWSEYNGLFFVSTSRSNKTKVEIWL